MRSWWGEGAGFRIALVEVVDILPAVVDAVVGAACAVPLIGSRMFDNAPLHWGPLCCLVPSRVPFSENFGCLVADNLPAFGIVSIAGVFAALPAIAVFVPLVVPVIDSGGGKGGPLILLFWCRPVICCACICAWCGCCVCITFIAGPPWPTDAI